jgi:hypothetical protein
MSIKIRLVCATRRSREDFSKDTPLGQSLALFPYPFVELRLFPSNSAGLPVVYNIALREAAADPAILVFIHDDVHLCDFFWPHHLYQALKLFDVVGLAGNKRRVAGQPGWRFLDDRLTRDEYCNLSGIAGHGYGWPPDRVSYFGPPYQPVKLLDGVLFAASSHILLSKKISFDERFQFHFYDMDFCRQAELAELRMGTCSISVVHESSGQFDTPAWRAAYAAYLQKWKS